ncbi:MAG: ABC transporter substrate-binding protein [Betaproteobacteria bacterium]|nr:MAG: ABC transporter substrate-binding protein [Betaproteobacteria bacterium]
MMDRRAFIATLARGLMAAPLTLLAQPQSRLARIGFLAAGSASTRVQQPFLQGMRELGLVEGRDFAVDWRFAEGRYERLPGLGAELVRLKVDVIVAVTTLCVQAAHQATTTTPIVMVGVPDPIGEGFAVSLSRPGGNITGLTNIVTEVSSKHLELLQVAVPRLSLVAVLINPGNPSDALILEQIEGTAYTRRIKVLQVEAGTASQIEAGFAAITRARAQAVIVATDSYFDVQQELIIKLAVGNRLPTISSSPEMTEAGGLMSYGQDLAMHYRRAATYVDKILKGAKPGSLPIEQPTVLEFVINRKTARVLGLVIPRELELRADRAIE